MALQPNFPDSPHAIPEPDIRGFTADEALWECDKGRRKIVVKVVDIFGKDTMKIIEVTI